MVQLAKQQPAFRESFLWIPSLAGPNPNAEIGFSWLLNSPSYAIPYLILPSILLGACLLQ